MLDGFSAELEVCKSNITSAKALLETAYAKILGKVEKDVLENAELIQEINNGMAAADSAFTSFSGTYKSIKASIDSQLIWYLKIVTAKTGWVPSTITFLLPRNLQ